MRARSDMAAIVRHMMAEQGFREVGQVFEGKDGALVTVKFTDLEISQNDGIDQMMHLAKARTATACGGGGQ